MADDLGFISTEDHSDLGFEPHPTSPLATAPLGQQRATPLGVLTTMAGQAGRALGIPTDLGLAPVPGTAVPQTPLEKFVGGIRNITSNMPSINGQPVAGDYSPLEKFVLGGMIPTEVPPVGSAVEASKAMTKGATAAAKAAPVSKTGATVGGAVGYGVGQSMGHPIIGTEVGAALGGAVPKAKAAVKGAGQALKDFRKPTPPPAIDYTMGGSEMAIPGIGPRPPQPPAPVVVRPSVDYTMGTGELSIPGIGTRPPTPEPILPEGLVRSNEAFPTGGSGGVAKQARRFTPGRESYGSLRGGGAKRTPGYAGMESLVPTPTPPPPVGLTVREGISSGPITPVEPLNIAGPMPPPVEGTLKPPTPPAPLPPPPKLLPTAAERDAMAAGKMMEQRIAKDVKLAQYFKDQGLDATAVRKLSDAEFNTHLAANKMRAASKSPSGLHRSLDEIREHIASRLEGRPY